MRSTLASIPGAALALVLADGAPLAARAQTAAVQVSAASASKDLSRAPAYSRIPHLPLRRQRQPVHRDGRPAHTAGEPAPSSFAR